MWNFIDYYRLSLENGNNALELYKLLMTLLVFVGYSLGYFFVRKSDKWTSRDRN